ncbi:MAG: YkvA family protein [Chloroflexaceae bacterium]|jgi:uncharacterized membrane protein YkvA (DUF1232 family)|nr:YkvA family protein [Chloroflexaceae bacterium]
MSPKQTTIVARLRARARRLKTDTLALYLAARHPATPWYAKVLAGLVVAYAFSPIDLIPDFVPVLGYLDDLILVPAGIALTLWLIPPHVLAECREQAAALSKRPTSRLAAAVIVLLWLGLAALLGLWLWRLFS